MFKSQFDFLLYYVSARSNFSKAVFPTGRIRIYESIYPVLSILAFRVKQSNGSARAKLFIKCLIRAILDGFFVSRVKYVNSNFSFCEILFWPIEQNHFDQQLPVARILQSKGINVGMIVSNEKFKDSLNNSKIPYVEFANSFSIIGGLPSLIKILVCLFKLYVCQIKSLSEVRFVKTGFLNFYPFICQSLDISKKVSNLTKIKAIFVGYDISIQGRVAALYFKETEVKTYSIMHGTLGPEYLFNCMVVDRLFLFGKLDYEKLMSINIDINSVELTGAPYLDKLNENLNHYTNNVINTKHDRRVLLALSGPGTSVSLDNHIQIINWVKDLAEAYSNCFFTIKLHRKDKRQFFEHLLSLKNVELIPQNHELGNDIFYWISINDLIITGASTVGLECHLLGKPSLCVDPLGELKNTYYVPDNRIEYFSDFNKLNLTFNRFIEEGIKYKDDRYFEQVITDYFYRFDGKSSERVVNSVIRDLC